MRGERRQDPAGLRKDAIGFGGIQSIFGRMQLVSAGLNKSSVDGDGIHEGEFLLKEMPAGEERQRSVLDEDSTGNEGLVVLSDRGLSDPGYRLLENRSRLAQYNTQ